MPPFASANRARRTTLLSGMRRIRACVGTTFIMAPPRRVHNSTTVEPLSNDHPHQRPSLLYDHILCDGHCFLFVRSLTNDYPSDATNDRVRWDFLPRERPPRLQCISKNRGWRFNIRSQSCIITMLCLDTFRVIQLI